jgi:hypothetical protein
MGPLSSGSKKPPEAIATPLGSSSGSGVDGRYELGDPARGPWRQDAAHGGAPAGLLVRAIEAHATESGMRLASFQSAFLGPVLLGPIEIETEVLKPGRRQSVVSARLTAASRTLVEARGIMLRRASLDLPGEVEVPASDEQAMPAPEAVGEIEGGRWGSDGRTSFHQTSNSIRAVAGGPEEVRRDGAAWFRLDNPLVPGEEPSPAQRAAAAADFGNGLAHPVPFGDYIFVNCDLNMWLLREPVDEWIGLKAVTEVSANGSGVTRTELHDRRGRFGTAGQSLYVDSVG